MAVYTNIDLATAKDALKIYNIPPITDITNIAEGVENSNFIIHTIKEKYILTLYEKRVDNKDVPYFLKLMTHLSDKGICCPEPLIHQGGGNDITLKGKKGALFTFLQGEWLRHFEKSHVGQVGECLAKMHIATEDFQDKRENTLSLNGWEDLLSQTIKGADNLRSGLNNALSMELNFLKKHWPENLPIGTCHADLFPDNIFFMDDKLCGVIDFYFACTDFLAYDLAVTLNAWCFNNKGEFSKEKSEALIQNYHKMRPLSPQECEAFPLLCRGASLRFLLTRLFDWLNHQEGSFVTPKDPLDYYRLLCFHQNITSINEYGNLS
jgi:homoserine kinase type II